MLSKEKELRGSKERENETLEDGVSLVVIKWGKGPVLVPGCTSLEFLVHIHILPGLFKCLEISRDQGLGEGWVLKS